MRIAAIMLVLAAIGCGSTVKVVRYTPEPFAPSDHVEVLTSEPARDFSAIAELSVKAGDNAVLELVEKAKAIGADAIILVGEKSAGAVAVPIGNMIYAAPMTRTVAVAIRFR
jgi:uncharacterized protein YbjQ (UPF0145 family)